MAEAEVVEKTESVRIDTVLLEVVREWADSSGRTVASQLREMLRPLCVAYLEGQTSTLSQTHKDKLEGIVSECTATVERMEGQ